MRQRVVQRRIDKIRSRSDNRNRAARTAQPAAMRRAIDTQRKPRHNREALLRKGLREAAGIINALRCRAPAADDRNRPRLEQVQPSLYI